MTLEELFRKYLDDQMTAEELALFREAATREENRAEMNRLLAVWIGREFPSPQPEEIDIDAMYLELVREKNIPLAVGDEGRAVGRARDSGRAEVAAGDVRQGRRMIRLVYSSVAAACLLVAAGLFLLRRPSPPTNQMAPRIVSAPVIIPASDKAVLTLADGTRIVLDSVANGRLASQGHTEVVKLPNGRLAYQAAGAGADPLLYNEIATPRGGFYQLILPDGSTVWLDAASSLRYPTAFTGKERSVELTGEAYFNIAPQHDQPFVIHSQGVTVQVLGTELNLMAYTDEDAIRTTLISGALRVVRGDDRRQIVPGQQASWSRGGNEWEVSHPDMREVLAWKQGEFRFEGLPIAAIMRQIARWYDVDVVFRGPLPEGEFNGVIPRKRAVAELLAVLEQTDEVHFTIEGRKIIVEAGKRN